ncbi:MAG: glycosyltransferase family 2 protein [candidate division Zixibacteria bacterium]|nr:glycosyltransferase family 2 protein [candidate division Zixibacteria bacterium]
MKISAVIITKNEEKNITRCLESLKWVDEIIVVDSESTDKTVEIAKSFNAKIVSPIWEGYGKAKNSGVDAACGEWILSVDADEELSEKLKVEIKEIINNSDACDGYYLKRKTKFMGQWILHCGWYPDYILRLFKKSKGRFDDKVIHERVIVMGTTGKTNGELLHYSYESLEQYFEKFNRYTTISAKEEFSKGTKVGVVKLFIKTFAAFVKHYIIKLGLLDGTVGFVISVLSAKAVFVKYSKLMELIKKEKHGNKN